MTLCIAFLVLGSCLDAPSESNQAIAESNRPRFKIVYVITKESSAPKVPRVYLSSTGSMSDFDGGLIDDEDLKHFIKKDADTKANTVYVELYVDSKKGVTTATLTEAMRRIEKAADPTCHTILTVMVRRQK